MKYPHSRPKINILKNLSDLVKSYSNITRKVNREK